MNKVKQVVEKILQVIGKFLKSPLAKTRKILQKPQAAIERTDENYTLPLGRILWNMVSVFGLLAIVVGIVVLIYSISPVFERSVDEPNLVKRHEISANEALANCSNPVKKKAVKKKVEEEEESCSMPQISLTNLAAVLPDVQFTKSGRRNICEHSEGYREYGEWGDWVYPPRCYEYGDIDSKFAENLRNRLQGWFPCDSASQQEIVDKMANHLNFYTPKSRQKIFSASMDWINDAKSMSDVQEVWEIFTAIDTVIGNAANENITKNVDDLFTQFTDFVAKNPKNGKTVLLKALELVKLAGGADRLETFKTERKYYKKLDVDSPESDDWKRGEWERATNRFAAMKELHGAEFAKNLACFYEAYLNEILERVQNNKELRNAYERERALAEAEAAETRENRREMIPVAGIILGIAVGVIMLVFVIIILSSLQRSVKRLEKALASRENEEKKQG